MKETVLLTGISGYIGLHCAAELLNQGYKVRGSLRDLAKMDEVLDALKGAAVDTSLLEFVALDLLQDKGWVEAAHGATYLMHVASPFVVANPKNEDEMIKPAVDGTLRAMRAAQMAGVKRVVLTSSIVAMMGAKMHGTFGPDDWTPTNTSSVSTYSKSKTLAEQAAWDFIKDAHREDDAAELVCVNPGGVFGPPLGNNISGQSMSMVSQMLAGKLPMVPNISFPMVDVRDVAQIHVKAMTHPEAAGLRIITSQAEGTSFSSIAQILIEQGYKGPSSRVAPSLLLKLVSLFDREAQGLKGWLDMNVDADNSKTVTLFDWTPRPFKECVIETAEAVSKLS